MKKYLRLLICILLLYFMVSNEKGVDSSSLELLATGFNHSLGKIDFYNYLLNITTMIIFISLLQSAISSTFKLRNYIATRGGKNSFINHLIKIAMYQILLILSVKQFVYIVFYLLSFSINRFYYFDIGSTALTLTFFSFVLIITKLRAVPGNVVLFTTVGIIATAQFLSYHFSIFSVIIIASKGWQEDFLLILVCKMFGIITLIYLMYYLVKEDKVKEVVEK